MGESKRPAAGLRPVTKPLRLAEKRPFDGAAKALELSDSTVAKAFSPTTANQRALGV
jgi:hypothetical protein